MAIGCIMGCCSAPLRPAALATYAVWDATGKAGIITHHAVQQQYVCRMGETMGEQTKKPFNAGTAVTTNTNRSRFFSRQRVRRPLSPAPTATNMLYRPSVNGVTSSTTRGAIPWCASGRVPRMWGDADVPARASGTHILHLLVV